MVLKFLINHLQPERLGRSIMKKTFPKSLLSFVMIISLVFCSVFATDITAIAATMGDVNSDNAVNSNDALLVLQYSTGTKSFNATQKALADPNADGKINSSDALEILRYATGESTLIKKSYKATVTADPTLRLRAGTGTSYAIIDNIPYGTELEILQTSGNWGKTIYNNKVGWVSLDYVSVSKPASGTFTIVSYGYGHGVGMSQYGAKYYAESGWKYDEILLHYYHSSKTKISTDSAMPSTVKYGSKSINLKQYIAGSVKAEMGDSWSLEAIKAQLVAIYTYAKYYNFNVSSSTHAYKENYNYSGTKIETAMNAVLGKYISYDGKAILSVYCSSIGGKTASAKDTWLGNDIPYLQGGRTTPEPESVMKRSYSFTANEIKTMVKNNLGVTLSGDPKTWFKDIVHDKSISNSIGHIISMNVGGTIVKGEKVRTSLFKYQVRSHCLSITYNP